MLAAPYKEGYDASGTDHCNEHEQENFDTETAPFR